MEAAPPENNIIKSKILRLAEILSFKLQFPACASSKTMTTNCDKLLNQN
jgi:hypothetical protein